MELVLGHNGAARLGQLAGLIGISPRIPRGPVRPQPPGPNFPQGSSSGGAPSPPSAQVPHNPVQSYNPPQAQKTYSLRDQVYAPQRGGLRDETGQPGPLRLFNRQLAGQIAWLLPLAFLSIFVAARRTRTKWPLEPEHQALILWTLWLIPQVIFFSYAGLFHRYYLTMLAPAVAALIGSGLANMLTIFRSMKPDHSGGLSWVLLPFALIGTMVVELYILWQFPDWARWLTPPILGLTLFASLGLVILFLVHRKEKTNGFFTIGVIAILTAPTIWAAIPVWIGGDSGLPYAGPELLERQKLGDAPDDSCLLNYLLGNRENEKFILAVPSSQIAAPIILETGEPVMALGGFSGNDQILTTESLKTKIVNHEVRFFLLPRPPRLTRPPNLNQKWTPHQGQSTPPATRNSTPFGKPTNPPPLYKPGFQPPLTGLPSNTSPSFPPVPPPVYPAMDNAPRSGQGSLIVWVYENCHLVPERIWSSPPEQDGSPVPGRPPMAQILWDCYP